MKVRGEDARRWDNFWIPTIRELSHDASTCSAAQLVMAYKCVNVLLAALQVFNV